MKLTLITFLLFISAFSKNFENDIAYKLVSTELNGAVPALFLEKAFSHEKLEIHDIIVERFEKPYEKKPWVEYRKIFVKESRVAAGAKFYEENKTLIQNVSKKSSYITPVPGGVGPMTIAMLLKNTLLAYKG